MLDVPGFDGICLTLLVIRYTYEVVETVEVGIPQAN